MNTVPHSFNDLFEQLGLESSDVAIENFLHQQAAIPRNLALHNASIWTSAQARFLREAKEQDAEWSYLVDELDVRLRRNRSEG